MGRNNGLSIEVLRFHEAIWAPRNIGVDFQWAWRIRDQDGSVIVSGLSKGSRAQARTAANGAIGRILSHRQGNVKMEAVRKSPGTLRRQVDNSRNSPHNKPAHQYDDIPGH